MTSKDPTTSAGKDEKIAKLEEARGLLLETVALIDEQIAEERKNRAVIRLD